MNICTSILFLSVIFLQLHPKVVFQMVDRECSIGKTIGKTKLIGSASRLPAKPTPLRVKCNNH
jgi:hypothetical protein